ncbi:unnamed protein product, partial [Rotaria sp. Silwood2]
LSLHIRKQLRWRNKQKDKLYCTQLSLPRLLTEQIKESNQYLSKINENFEGTGGTLDDDTHADGTLDDDTLVDNYILRDRSCSIYIFLWTKKIMIICSAYCWTMLLLN